MAQLETVSGGRHRAWVATTAPTLLDLELLLVDDAYASKFLRDLQNAGVHVHCCTHGTDALVLFGKLLPQAVVIAPSLPDIEPAAVVGSMRRHGADTILLGVGAGDTELAGPALMAGATAAVRRPYRAAEVLGQVRNHLQATSHDTRLEFGPLRLDVLAHSVRVNDFELDPLPLKEFNILRCMMRHGDQLVTAEQLKAFAWVDADPRPSDNTVAVHVKRLRSRLPPPFVILNLRGLGYRLTMSR